MKRRASQQGYVLLLVMGMLAVASFVALRFAERMDLRRQEALGLRQYVEARTLAQGAQATECLPALAWHNPAGNVLGLYLHGLFESPQVLQALFGAAAPTLDDAFERMAQGVAQWFAPDALPRILPRVR